MKKIIKTTAALLLAVIVSFSAVGAVSTGAAEAEAIPHTYTVDSENETFSLENVGEPFSSSYSVEPTGYALFAQSEVLESKYPKTINRICTNLSLYKDDCYDDYGNASLKYTGTKTTEADIAAAEKYIDYLEEKCGYYVTSSPDHSKGGSTRKYYLDTSDTSIKAFKSDGKSCRLMISLFTNDKYDWHVISIYYSPSIVSHYRTVDNSSGSDSGSSSGSYSGGSSYGSSKDKSCSHCGGSGKIKCTTCGGKGYWTENVTSPYYGGLGSSGGSKTVTKDCPYCVGGYKDCPYC